MSAMAAGGRQLPTRQGEMATNKHSDSDNCSDDQQDNRGAASRTVPPRTAGPRPPRAEAIDDVDDDFATTTAYRRLLRPRHDNSAHTLDTILE